MKVFAVLVVVLALGPARVQAHEMTMAEMEVRGWRQKVWRTRKGTVKGGREFDWGALVRLLRNVVYRGQVQYEGTLYQGEQAAIVEKHARHHIERG